MTTCTPVSLSLKCGIDSICCHFSGVFFLLEESFTVSGCLFPLDQAGDGAFEYGGVCRVVFDKLRFLTAIVLLAVLVE